MEFRLGYPGIKIIGPANYLKLFSDPVFVTSFVNTILYAVAMVPVSIFSPLSSG